MVNIWNLCVVVTVVVVYVYLDVGVYDEIMYKCEQWMGSDGLIKRI